MNTVTAITGSQVKISTALTDEANAPQDAGAGTLTLRVVSPSGISKTYAMDELEHGAADSGDYWLFLIANESGLWNYRWYVEKDVADEGTFTVESAFDHGLEPDLLDLRVLVPAARRAMEGPYGAPAGTTALSNEQVYQQVADACADVILYAGTLFGHELLVKARDPLVGFPTEWKTDTELSLWEGSVIVNQAALDYFFHLFRDFKTSETIQNEGTQWTYELSANVLRSYLETLKDNRDKAIAALRLHHPVLDQYASNIRVRDQATVAVLEWWDNVSPGISGGGLPGGQEASVVPWFPGDFANP
jgi:hypothetical protein